MDRLIDALNDNGTFYDPGGREAEADAVEDLRRGYLTVFAYVPLKDLRGVLRGRLGLTDTEPTYADWARLRYYLQGVMQVLLESHALLFARDQHLVNLEPDALETPDVYALLAAQDPEPQDP